MKIYYSYPDPELENERESFHITQGQIYEEFVSPYAGPKVKIGIVFILETKKGNFVKVFRLLNDGRGRVSIWLFQTVVMAIRKEHLKLIV